MTPPPRFSENRGESLAYLDVGNGSDIVGYPYGDVAQLGERRVRNAKVEGSIPFVSSDVSSAESVDYAHPPAWRCG